MNGEDIAKIIPPEKIREFLDAQQATQQAHATPLPGPLREAFALKPDIEIGPYKVRAIKDRDFEYLQLLDNPLHYQMSGKDFDFKDLVMGDKAREVCFLFTTPFAQIKEIIKTGGADGFRKAAQDAFDDADAAQYLAILTGVYRQIEIYWSPIVAHEAPTDKGESKKNSLADGTDNPQTD